MCIRLVKWSICLSFSSLVSSSTKESESIGKHNYFKEKEWDFKGSLNTPIKLYNMFWEDLAKYTYPNKYEEMRTHTHIYTHICMHAYMHTYIHTHCLGMLVCVLGLL